MVSMARISRIEVFGGRPSSNSRLAVRKTCCSGSREAIASGPRSARGRIGIRNIEQISEYSVQSTLIIPLSKRNPRNYFCCNESLGTSTAGRGLISLQDPGPCMSGRLRHPTGFLIPCRTATLGGQGRPISAACQSASCLLPRSASLVLPTIWPFALRDL